MPDHWDEDEYDFDEVSDPWDDQPEECEPSGLDEREQGILDLDYYDDERVFVGVYLPPVTAERVETVMYRVSMLSSVLKTTVDTFKAQWRLQFRGGHTPEELHESSKRALARLTLVSGARTIEEKVVGYSMVRQDERDLLLSTASQLQVGASALIFIGDTYGQHIVDQALARTGTALMSLAEEEES